MGCMRAGGESSILRPCAEGVIFIAIDPMSPCHARMPTHGLLLHLTGAQGGLWPLDPGPWTHLTGDPPHLMTPISRD